MNKDKLLSWIELQIKVMEKRIRVTTLTTSDIDYIQGQIDGLEILRETIRLNPKAFE